MSVGASDKARGNQAPIYAISINSAFLVTTLEMPSQWKVEYKMYLPCIFEKEGFIVDKFAQFLQNLDILQIVTEEEVKRTETLLRVYGPMLRSASQSLVELNEFCYEGRRQSISDFINLSIDYDHDTARQRIAERLNGMGHAMQLLSILESALFLVKEDHRHGELYYKILSVRYFNTCFRSNEDAFLALGMASSTYYRHSKKAVRMYAAYLWCIIIPDLILKEQMQDQSTSALAES